MVYAIDARQEAVGRQGLNVGNIELDGLQGQIANSSSDEEEKKNHESINSLYTAPHGFDSFSSAFKYWELS